MKEAIALRPTSPQLWLELGEIQACTAGNETLSIATYRKAISFNASSSPRDPAFEGKVYTLIGISSINMLDFKSAQEAFESAAIVDPVNAARYYLQEANELLMRDLGGVKGWNASKQKQYNALMLAAASKAVSLSPDSAKAHRAMAEAFEDSGFSKEEFLRNLRSVWRWILPKPIARTMRQILGE